MTLTVWHALPPDSATAAGDRLRAALGAVSLRPWYDNSAPDGLLLLAPHEFTDHVRAEICAATPWSWVHLSSAGVDFLDLDGWPERTLLTRSWRCYAAPLAEYAVHAILSHEWRGAAPWALADHRAPASAEGAPVPEPPGDQPRGLSGARIGVAGWGEAGQRIGAAVRALGADVVVLRRAGPDATTIGCTVTDRPHDLVDADHLVVALPLTGRTRHLFDDAVLTQARAGLHLVNVSRPQILDQDALYRQCAAGRMSATLDVTWPEPLPPAHPLASLPSVRLSPHVAWRSRSTGLAYIDDFASLVTTMAAGDQPPPSAHCAGGADSARAVLKAWREVTR